MDATDRKILALLQEDASLSVAEIGSRVGLSSTPCWKRIQRLEADGVLLKRVALVDQDKLGLGVTVFVSIETGDHSQDWLDSFAQVVGWPAMSTTCCASSCPTSRAMTGSTSA
jgi:Lrp/AsnC family transcriptional regulator